MEALLIIDMQCGMFGDPAVQPHIGEAVVRRIAELVEAVRAANRPLIFVQHDGGVGDVLARGTLGFAFRPELAPQDTELVVVKRFCSAFQETGLADLLAARKISGVSICGMQTEYCIDTTCRSAFEHGLAVTLISDAHTTFDNGVLTANAIIRHHNKTLASGFAKLRKAADLIRG